MILCPGVWPSPRETVMEEEASLLPEIIISESLKCWAVLSERERVAGLGYSTTTLSIIAHHQRQQSIKFCLSVPQQRLVGASTRFSLHLFSQSSPYISFPPGPRKWKRRLFLMASWRVSSVCRSDEDPTRNLQRSRGCQCRPGDGRENGTHSADRRVIALSSQFQDMER